MSEIRLEGMPHSAPSTEEAAMKEAIKEYVLTRLARPLSDERRRQLDAELAAVADFFHAAGISFFIAGGSGLDLLDGTWDRDHQDVDVAILSSQRRAFYAAATKQGYLIANPDRQALTLAEIEKADTHNAFLFRSDAKGTSLFEVMFLEQNAAGDIVLDRRVISPRALYDQAPKAVVLDREVRLEPVEVNLFYKLLDGRRKDMRDVLKVWFEITDEQRARVQDWIDRSGYVFVLGGKRTTEVAELLQQAPAVAGQKETQFFDQEAIMLEAEEAEEVMQKCQAVFSMREAALTREAFSELLIQTFRAFMPEQAATIAAMSDYLYQNPAPSFQDFVVWAKKQVGLLDRLKKKALQAFMSQKIWDSRPLDDAPA